MTARDPRRRCRLGARAQEYEKRQLVKILDEEKGIGKTYAYRMIDEAKSRGILRLNKVTKTYALR
jgi:hypothetical protein